MRRSILRRLTPTLAFLLVCIACERKVSDRDVQYVEVSDAYVLGQEKTGILGIGSSAPVWVDPRPGSAYRAEHIPGAVHVPLDDVRADDPRLAGFNVLIVYGDDYNSPLATAMTKKLIALGYDDVRTLRGGLRAWKQAGNEVATEGGP